MMGPSYDMDVYSQAYKKTVPCHTLIWTLALWEGRMGEVGQVYGVGSHAEGGCITAEVLRRGLPQELTFV